MDMRSEVPLRLVHGVGEAVEVML